MCRFLAFFLAVTLIYCSSAVASIQVQGLPATYTPATSFTFDIALAPTTNLAKYNVKLKVESSDLSAVAGVDFFFDSFVRPADARYVFGAGGLFYLANDDYLLNLATLDVGDANLFGVNTAVGVNDLVATVTMNTTKDVGDLTFKFATDDNLILSQTILDNVPISEYTAIETEIKGSPGVVVASSTVIPEPTSFVVWSLLGVLCLVCNCRRKCAA